MAERELVSFEGTFDGAQAVVSLAGLYSVGLLTSPPAAASPQALVCASRLKLICPPAACWSRKMRSIGPRW